MRNVEVIFRRHALNGSKSSRSQFLVSPGNYRAFLRHSAHSLILETLYCQTLRRREIARVALSKGKRLLRSRRESPLYIVSHINAPCNSSLETTEISYIPWDQCSRNGTRAMVTLVRQSRESHHRGRSSISFVVNCCQISIVPRGRSRWIASPYLIVFSTLGPATVLPFYFIHFHDSGMPMKRRKKRGCTTLAS